MGLITESALLLDACLTALFGGGAALALGFGPSDASTFVAPPTTTRLNQSRKAGQMICPRPPAPFSVHMVFVVGEGVMRDKVNFVFVLSIASRTTRAE